MKSVGMCKIKGEEIWWIRIAPSYTKLNYSFKIDGYWKFQSYQYAVQLMDELGLRILAWELPPQLIEREELSEGLSALWADSIIWFALTTCFPGLDALIVKHVSATSHVP